VWLAEFSTLDGDEAEPLQVGQTATNNLLLQRRYVRHEVQRVYKTAEPSQLAIAQATNTTAEAAARSSFRSFKCLLWHPKNGFRSLQEFIEAKRRRTQNKVGKFRRVEIESLLVRGGRTSGLSRTRTSHLANADWEESARRAKSCLLSIVGDLLRTFSSWFWFFPGSAGANQSRAWDLSRLLLGADGCSREALEGD
jgi:hypothetical protein